MSHSSGLVKFPDDKIFWYEYNGTVDVCLPFLYETGEEMMAHWRRTDWKYCTCNNPSENVFISSSYGNGFYWQGMACRTCMIITKELEPNYDTEIDGLPDWHLNLLSPETRKLYKDLKG